MQDSTAQQLLQNETTKIGTTIFLTASRLSKYRASLLKRLKLSYQQYLILNTLSNRKKNTASIKELKAEMFDGMSNVSRIVDRLEFKGLIVRECNYHDRRQTMVQITPEGKQFYKASEILLEEMDNKLNVITDEEQKELKRIFQKISL